jgi:EmrB/QacA subfamily drug resistance transporter
MKGGTTEQGEISKTSVLIVIGVSAFIPPFMGSSINIALPAIGREFSMDAVLLNWVATSYLLGAAAFLVPFGRIADIHGKKRVFTIGMVVYTIFSFLSGMATSATSLILFRLLQGMGSAMEFATGIAILTSVFPPGERGRALGINVAAVYIGLTIGPFLGGVLTQYLGWRSVLLFNVPLGLLVIGLVFWKLHGEWAGASGENFDLWGSIVYSLTLVAVMYGFSLLPGMKGVWFILAGILGLLAFLWREMRVEQPVFNIDLFRKNRVFAFSNLAAFIHYAATFGIVFLMSLYLQYIKGLTPQTAGLVLVSEFVVMAIFSPMAGRLSDRVDPQIVASVGMAITTIGLFLFVPLSETTGLASIVAYLALVGFGFALFSSPNTNAIMSSVERRFLGIASAIVGTMRLTGQMFSMGLIMVVFAVTMGRVQITPEYYHLFMGSMRSAYLIYAFLCLIGVFASLARGRTR